MLTSDVYCSIYSTFHHNPRNTTNYNNIKFKKNHSKIQKKVFRTIGYFYVIKDYRNELTKVTFLEA